MAEVICGINPVRELLRARRRSVEKVLISSRRSDAAAEEIMELAAASGAAVERVDRGLLDRECGGRGHQGTAVRAGEYPYLELSEIIEASGDGPALVLALDGVEDPMNLGSLLRSADAAGAVGVVLPRERAAGITPAAVRASAGAAEWIRAARVVNLARSLDELKAAGFWAVGADADAETAVFDCELNARLVLAVGGEGRGLRRLVRAKCDYLASIPRRGGVASLNAGAAGAVCLFEYVRQHHPAGGKSQT